MWRSPQRRAAARVAALTVALGAAVSGQAPPQPPFKTDTSAVMVDVVVRDKKGSPVTDLRKQDFELLEDGVRQEIGDMTLVGGPPGQATVDPGGARAGAGTAEPNAATAPGRSPSVVALVFDRLSPEARALAHEGALSYLTTTHDGEFAGVFLVDQALHTLQTYTTDKSAVRRAIDDAATRASAKFDRNNDKILAGFFGDRNPATSLTASAEEQGPITGSTPTTPGGANGTKTLPGAAVGRGSYYQMMAMVDRMERSYEAMMRDEQGYATTNALLALVESLSMLPGRKTVVLFAEGLAIPPAVQARFASVVGAANRANVSVYTVDAAGLRVHSGQMETAATVTAIGTAALDRQPENGGKLTELLEFNEDTLRKDPSVSLRLLATQTGGFLIDNTNDLAQGFKTIDADRRFHYLLTYVPKNAAVDGTWRSLTVRVPSRRVEVRARSGYVAVRQPGVLPLLAYEAPALALFERMPPPADIPVRVGSFTFPAGGTDSIVALLVDVEAQHVAFEVTDQGYRTDFTVLAQMRDASGEVVRKGSFHYRLRGTPGQVDAARAGHVLFYRQPTVPPGRYSLEVAVLDSFGRRATVQRMPIEVPGPGLDDPAVGSLVVVRSTEPVAPGESRGNPLVVDGVLAYPNLGDPVSLGAGALTLLFSVKAKPGEDLSVELEVLQEDVAVAAGPVDLRPPGEDGRIRQFASVPAATLLTGECLVRLTVSHGDRRTVRTATVRLVQ